MRSRVWFRLPPVNWGSDCENIFTPASDLDFFHLPCRQTISDFIPIMSHDVAKYRIHTFLPLELVLLFSPRLSLGHLTRACDIRGGGGGMHSTCPSLYLSPVAYQEPLAMTLAVGAHVIRLEMLSHKSDAEDSITNLCFRNTVVFAALCGLLGLVSVHRTEVLSALRSCTQMPDDSTLTIGVLVYWRLLAPHN